RPGEGREATPTCAVIGFGAGTFRNVGGLLHWVDCTNGYRVTDTFDQVADSNPALKPYSFSDSPRDQYNSDSDANVANPWGDKDDASYAQVWDCSQPQQKVDLGTQGQVNVSMPKVPPSVSPTGTLGGTANATASGFDECTRPTDNSPSGHLGATAGDAPYAGESGASNPTYKIAADWTLTPSEVARPAAPLAAALGKGTPADGGVRDMPGAGLEDIPNIIVSGSGNQITADGLWSGFPNLIVSETSTNYFTYYAYISPTLVQKWGLSLAKGIKTGSYGVEACGTSGTGIIAGWDCNNAHWYKDSTGEDTQPKSTYFGPGPDGSGVSIASFLKTPYNLLDVDCNDNSVPQLRANGVTTTIVQHTLHSASPTTFPDDFACVT
ncbi:MAG: hypothetical protein WDA16_15235, partial [Candidatus Thermoplasmatota archaeon]